MIEFLRSEWGATSVLVGGAEVAVLDRRLTLTVLDGCEAADPLLSLDGRRYPTLAEAKRDIADTYAAYSRPTEVL